MAPLTERQKLLRKRILLLAIARRRQQHKHRLWVRDIYRDRETFGEYHHLYPQLREDEDKFFEYFRMSIATFDLLLSKISHRLQKRSIRQAIHQKSVSF